ncbi:MAG: M48 family metallopeptidase [Rhodoferax sp.]|nr:M48 family metallopeptidase [Rhodoferax sp.]
MTAKHPDKLAVSYFDGTSARARPVTLHLEGGTLRVTGADIQRSIAVQDVLWPERTRHGIRAAHFKTGGSVQCDDAPAWDAWWQDSGHADSLVVRMQQSWRSVLASVLALLAIAVALQQWGLPVAARAVVAATPLSVDEFLGKVTLEAMDEHLMRPSKLPEAQRARLQVALARAVSALPAGTTPAWQLLFRQSRIGPNALALPGGILIMTDELIELVGGDDKVLTAVLAHELGHVQHRHGLRMLVQSTVLGTLGVVVLGDFSTLLATVPVLLGQSSYSRDAEREADVMAVRILKAAAISPEVMVTLFEKMAEKRRKTAKGTVTDTDQESLLGIAFSSHPPDADRVRYFMEAAAGR